MAKPQLATFAEGCFWNPEVVFRNVEGVIDTRVGYTGGHTKNPSYEDVCSDTTGHAEAIEIEFDPDKVSYEDLLKVFWESHDPTQLNQQGPDVGSQYRSAIFYHDENQRKLAEESRSELEGSGAYPAPIVTEIQPAKEFYGAEEYHQQYLVKRGLASCRI